MIETRGMDGYVLAIFCHTHSNLSTCAARLDEVMPRPGLTAQVATFPEPHSFGALKAQSETQCIRILETCMMVRP